MTIADREAEIRITPRLLALCNGSRVVREEATALNPSLMADLDNGTVWLVVPLDGTANFAAGRPPFALMVALLSRGETVAAWMLDPLSRTIAPAERGAGAWIDGRRIATTPGSPGPAYLRGAVFTRFMPSDVARAVLARSDRIGEALPGLMCCGAEYPTIAAGEEDIALFGALGLGIMLPAFSLSTKPAASRRDPAVQSIARAAEKVGCWRPETGRFGNMRGRHCSRDWQKPPKRVEWTRQP